MVLAIWGFEEFRCWHFQSQTLSTTIERHNIKYIHNLKIDEAQYTFDVN